MKYWFTGDWHFGHFNIIKYANRPFKTLEEMNETIIKKYNERVRAEDCVFVLGDCAFRNSPGGKEGEGVSIKPIEYIKRMNGKMVFIRGNHDRNNSLKTIIENLVIRYGNYLVNLVHDPEKADFRYLINFVAHVHDHWKFKRLVQGEQITDCCNIGVDQWNFYPVSFEEIIKEYRLWKKTNNYN